MTTARMIVASACLLLLGWTSTAVAQNHEAQQAGFQSHHDYIGYFPFESIDPHTGSVVLTFTDFSLPDNGGLDLTWTRTLNTKTQQWTFGLAGIPMKVVHAEYPEVTSLDEQPAPELFTSDGARHPTFATTSAPTATIWQSTELWRYHRAQHILRLPNGLAGRYDLIDTAGAQSGIPYGANIRYLTRVEDPFGNAIDLTYVQGANGPQINHIVQHVASGGDRHVYLVYDGTLLRTVTYHDRTWTYSYLGAGILYQVDQPEGAPWQYQWDTGTFGLHVTTPNGGRIHYTLAWHDYEKFPAPGLVNTPTVTDRDVYDRNGTQLGHWHFDYDNPGGAFRTTIFAPGYTVIYRSALGGTYVPPGYPIQIQVIEGGTVVRDEQRTWEQGPGVGIINAQMDDGALWRLKQRIVNQGGQLLQTDYEYSASNFGDYNQPFRITESGNPARVTVRTYKHDFSRYIRGRLASETVTTTDSVTRTFTYDNNTGFRTGQNLYGIPTTFEPDGVGNVYRAVDASGHATIFGYQWGVLSGTWKPQTTVERVINPDGTVAQETHGSRTTRYFYDRLSRLRRTEPPNTNAIVTDYPADGASMTLSRGSSQVVTTLDGFGRPVQTINLAGVRTRIEYDAEGRRTYESLPYTGADVGTHTSYDALGRVRERLHSDGSHLDIEYSGDTATITDEIGGAARQTRQTWQAYGDPDDRWLVEVRDAAGQIWSYSYNALGKLTHVSGPPGPNGEAIARTFHYPPGRSLMDYETHPESGTTTYGYDAVGNLTSKADANGIGFIYAYDGNDRLIGVNAGGRLTSIGYEPGSDLRQIANGPSVGSTFVYDAAGRLQHRSDVIDSRRFAADFAYDGNDNLTTITYTSGRRVRLDYDSENRVVRVWDETTGTDYARNATYHPSGGLTSYQSGNGIVHTMGYHPTRYWLTSVDAADLHLSYSDYDAVGNVHTIGDSRPGMTQTFNYDSLDRLTVANGPYGSITIDYDAHGNRMSGVGATYQYQPGTMRLTAQNGLPFGYYPNGNLQSGPNASYSYTPENLLESATVNGAATGYAYDVDDWRTKKFSGSTASYFSRGARGELLTEWANPDTASASIKDYVYAGARLLAEAERLAPLGSTPAQPPLPGPPPTSPAPGPIGSPGTTIPPEGEEPPPPVCTDPAAINYNQPGECQYPPPATARFYVDDRFGGEFADVATTPYVGDYWNDRFSSVRVAPGTKVVLYEYANYQGGRLVLTSDVADLILYQGPFTYGWTDRVSSVRVLSANAPIPPPTGESVIARDQVLMPEWSRTSDNGVYRLLYQATDGNLVLFQNGTPVWANDVQHVAGFAAMQGDGNFVIYDANGTPQWSTNTQGHPDSYLVVQDDGNVAVYDVNGAQLYAIHPTNRLESGQFLTANQPRWSADGELTLIYQGDGRLVVYTRGGGILWQNTPFGSLPGVAVMQTDGNFVVYDGNGAYVWDTATPFYEGRESYLIVGGSDMLDIFTLDGFFVWRPE